MTKLMSECEIGESGSVKKVSGEGRMRRRLFDMGITPGAPFTMKKRAPFGDPIEITLRGYELTLRLSEAACVEVEIQ
ncbi:MAG: ferrous iron transport protein A [Clostridiales bacterium]|nr:ferrous iron transport protein A [Clostridiales bacterium]